MDLDAVRWIGPGYPCKREAAEAVAVVERSAQGNTWIIEGVHGWLADVAFRAPPA
ncbi:MAG: hypothetical protein INR68_05640 [Methylobacterium mesophilicum]|nr:hypothetical protein [Methylobacterium mesophilicum]